VSKLQELLLVQQVFIFNDTTSFPDNSFSGGTTTFIYLTNVIGEFLLEKKLKYLTVESQTS
jgi:hypothetical protein